MKDEDYFKDIFKDFYELYYKETGPSIREDLRDYRLSPSDYIILRRQAGGDYIYMLCSGTSIYIPFLWVDIFSSLNTYDGDKVLKGIGMWTIDDKVSGVIFLMTHLIHLVDALGSRNFGGDVIDTFNKICQIGTKEFRDWVKEGFGIDLPPLEYRSLDEFIEI